VIYAQLPLHPRELGGNDATDQFWVQCLTPRLKAENWPTRTLRCRALFVESPACLPAVSAQGKGLWRVLTAWEQRVWQAAIALHA
jgi:hypothetical protein